MNGPALDVHELFDADYLYFYEPRLAEASDADTELIWRLLEPKPEITVLDLAWARSDSESSCRARRLCLWR